MTTGDPNHSTVLVPSRGFSHLHIGLWDLRGSTNWSQNHFSKNAGMAGNCHGNHSPHSLSHDLKGRGIREVWDAVAARLQVQGPLQKL